MQKRNLGIITILGFFLVNFVSAYNGYYSGRFSLGDFFNSFDSSTVILGTLFILFFLFVNFSLMKFFKNSGLAGVGAFCVSFLMVYGINKGNFDIENLFYNLGFSSDILFPFVVVLLIGSILFLTSKFGFGMALMALGALFCFVSLTDVFYEKGVAFFLGVAFLVAGYFANKKFPKEKKPKRRFYY